MWATAIAWTSESPTALTRCWKTAKEQDITTFIRSSFRTRDEQQQILNERVALYREAGYSEEEALAAALQWVAPPGTSEHELGLAVGINDEEDDEGMYAWLASNAHQYGFILRYPLDKVDVTGISNEPWHYRYVGKRTAGEIYQTGETLEEYLARTRMK